MFVCCDAFGAWFVFKQNRCMGCPCSSVSLLLFCRRNTVSWVDFAFCVATPPGTFSPRLPGDSPPQFCFLVIRSSTSTGLPKYLWLVASNITFGSIQKGCVQFPETTFEEPRVRLKHPEHFVWMGFPLKTDDMNCWVGLPSPATNKTCQFWVGLPRKNNTTVVCSVV